MRHICLMSLTALLLALAAQAQTQPAGPPEPGARPAPPGRAMALNMVANRLASELQLTEEQRTKYDALLAKYEALVNEPAPESEREQMRALGEQLREARRNGDEKRAEELRAQMQALRAGRAEATTAFLDEVATLLTPEQQETLKRFRAQLRQRQETTRRAGDLRDLVRTLPEELGLNAEQKARFDELMTEQRQLVRERFQQTRAARPKLQEQLRQAREAGDQARVTELEAQLAPQHPEAAGFQELLDKLQLVLTPEQKAKLETLRANLAARAHPGPEDVQTLLRAARALELSDEQQTQLRKIAQDARQAERSATDDAARTELAKRVKIRIIELLNAKQVPEFERLLAEEPPGRPGRPSPAGPPEQGPPPGTKTPG